VIRRSCVKNSSKTAQVSRQFRSLEKVKESDRFYSKIYEDDNKCLETVTYQQLHANILNFGAGLRSLGMTPLHLQEGQSFEQGQAAHPGGAFVMVIFEDTCKQWTTAMQGAFSQSLTVATCYATLGEAAVIDIVNETAATTLMLNWKHANRFVVVVASSCFALFII